MQITINRQNKNHLYTEGTLLINGKAITLTVEATQTMLSPGTYQVRLSKKKARRRLIGIRNTPWSIGIGHSWLSSHRDHLITLGKFLIPGALYRATPVYERLFDRIEKCERRHEPITLTIREDCCTSCHPISHWLKA